jgi:hypothetical protein
VRPRCLLGSVIGAAIYGGDHAVGDHRADNDTETRSL